MTKPRPRGAARTREAAAIVALAAPQLICAAVFLEQLISSILGLRTTPVSWTVREIVEIMAASGLLLGAILGALLIRAALRQRREAQHRLRAASGEFQALVNDEFDAWGLTPSERDVALFMLKGFANSEIAAMRETSEGTIKVQTTAVFRKAGVSGRPQLLSHFIEELMADDSTGRDPGEGA